MIKEFVVKPTVDIYAIAIGPECFERDYIENPYYFLDNLILADIREFEFTISGDGNVCDDSFTLNLPERDTVQYQWYRNGIAVVGETSSSIKPKREGRYQVVLQSPGSCKVTKVYDHVIPQANTILNEYLCDGSTRDFHGRLISESGSYQDTLTTINGCDSIIELQITKVVDSPIDVQAKIFPGESYYVGPKQFKSPTSEMVTIQSTHGCDSSVVLDLQYYEVFVPNTFTPNGDGVNDYFAFSGSDELQLIAHLKIFDRWGSIVFEKSNFQPFDEMAYWDGTANGAELPEGTYIYQAIV